MAGQVNLGRVVGENGQGVPTGGSVGQALVKKSTSNYDTEWKTMVPTGGSAGQTLVKRTSTNYDTEWGTLNTATPESIAIVANGNTHVAITAGQYVYVRGHASLAEGLYTATTAIPVNDAQSVSNLTAVSGGGLNELSSIVNKISTGSVDVTGSASLAEMMGRIVSSGTKVGTGLVGINDSGTLSGILGVTSYNYANCRILYRSDILYEIFAIPLWGETSIQKKYIYFENGVQEWKLTAWQTISM